MSRRVKGGLKTHGHKRGRPRKTTLKYKRNRPEKEIIFKRKRGRPRKTKIIEESLSNITKSKFLGHCPKCNFVVTSRDLESKRIYICLGCRKRARISTLKKESGTEKPLSKKEYLEPTNANFHDMPALNDVEHGELKVAE